MLLLPPILHDVCNVRHDSTTAAGGATSQENGVAMPNRAKHSKPNEQKIIQRTKQSAPNPITHHKMNCGNACDTINKHICIYLNDSIYAKMACKCIIYA